MSIKIKFNEDALEEQIRKIAKEHMENETFDIPCPHCNEDINVPQGKSKCPKCDEYIELELYFDF